MDNAKVLVLIPTLNEAAAIRGVIDEVHASLDLYHIEHTVVVADGGSYDGTVQIVNKMGEKLIPLPRGKGNQVRNVLHMLDLAANTNDEMKYDYLFMLDGDGTYPAYHIPSLLQTLLPPEERSQQYINILGKGFKVQYDAVCGARIMRMPGAMPRVNLFGNIMLTSIANLLYWPTKTDDLCTGMWGFRRETIERLDLSAHGFELEADLFANIAKGGMRLCCLPIAYRTRQNGDKPKLRVADGGRIAWKLLRERFA